jgi:uncharacterized protein YpmS
MFNIFLALVALAIVAVVLYFVFRKKIAPVEATVVADTKSAVTAVTSTVKTVTAKL